MTSVLVGKFPALIFMRFKTYTLTRTKLREERKREREEQVRVGGFLDILH